VKPCVYLAEDLLLIHGLYSPDLVGKLLDLGTGKTPNSVSTILRLKDTPGVKYFLVAAPWLERHGSHKTGDPGAASETWDTIARVLTGKRMELLRSVRRNNVTQAETV
jgi:hypothetical protein